MPQFLLSIDALKEFINVSDIWKINASKLTMTVK